MRVAAVILAGGRGERLGGAIKANLVIGGRSLLHRVSEALGSLPQPVLVAHGAIPPERLALLPGQVAVADIPCAQAGPIVGLASAAAHCRGMAEPPEALISVAVDTPFVPHDYADRLVAAFGAALHAVIVRYAGQDYPTNAIWRLDAIADLPERLGTASAPRSLRRLAADLAAARLDWPEASAGDPFANVNTPADLAALESRAASAR